MRYVIDSRLIGQRELDEILSTAYHTARTQVSLYDRNGKLLLRFHSFNYGRHYHDVQQALLDGVYKITCDAPGHSASEEGRKPECVDAAKVALNVAAWAATGAPFIR